MLFCPPVGWGHTQVAVQLPTGLRITTRALLPGCAPQPPSLVLTVPTSPLLGHGSFSACGDWPWLRPLCFPNS